jgi:hypothetical protein
MRVKADLLVVNVDLSVSSEGGHVANLLLSPESGYFAQLPPKPRAGLGAWRDIL